MLKRFNSLRIILRQDGMHNPDGSVRGEFVGIHLKPEVKSALGNKYQNAYYTYANAVNIARFIATKPYYMNEKNGAYKYNVWTPDSHPYVLQWSVSRELHKSITEIFHTELENTNPHRVFDIGVNISKFISGTHERISVKSLGLSNEPAGKFIEYPMGMPFGCDRTFWTFDMFETLDMFTKYNKLLGPVDRGTFIKWWSDHGFDKEAEQIWKRKQEVEIWGLG